MAIQRLGSSLVQHKEYVLSDFLDMTINSLTPKMFGAKGDGVTDDTKAFQDCIDALAQPANLGKTMHITPGSYMIFDTLKVSRSLRVIGGSHAYYDGTTRMFCGKPNMTMWHFGYSENQVIGLIISDYLPITDPGNNYGQGGTCRGMEFVRDNGSKDLDSWLIDCMIVGFKEGMYAEGANLKHRGGIYTACRNPITLKFAASAPDDFRGFILDDLRFHSCGSGIAGEDVSCITTIGTFKNSRITNAFVDGGCRKFYKGALAETSVIRGVTHRYNYQYAASIEVINTGITPSLAYQNYQIDNVIYESPGSTATVMGAECIRLVDAPGGLITNITTAFTGKGFLVATRSDDIMLANIYCRNLHVIDTGASVYALDLTTCKNWVINGLFIRNSLRAGQLTAVIKMGADCTGISIDNVGWNNSGPLYAGGGRPIGNSRNTLDTDANQDITSATTTLAVVPGRTYKFTGSGTLTMASLNTNFTVGSQIHISFATGTGSLVLPAGNPGLDVSTTKTYLGSKWDGSTLTLVLNPNGWQPTSPP